MLVSACPLSRGALISGYPLSVPLQCIHHVSMHGLMLVATSLWAHYARQQNRNHYVRTYAVPRRVHYTWYSTTVDSQRVFLLFIYSVSTIGVHDISVLYLRVVASARRSGQEDFQRGTPPVSLASCSVSPFFRACIITE